MAEKKLQDEARQVIKDWAQDYDVDVANSVLLALEARLVSLPLHTVLADSKRVSRGAKVWAVEVTGGQAAIIPGEADEDSKGFFMRNAVNRSLRPGTNCSIYSTFKAAMARVAQAFGQPVPVLDEQVMDSDEEESDAPVALEVSPRAQDTEEELELKVDVLRKPNVCTVLGCKHPSAPGGRYPDGLCHHHASMWCQRHPTPDSHNPNDTQLVPVVDAAKVFRKHDPALVVEWTRKGLIQWWHTMTGIDGKVGGLHYRTLRVSDPVEVHTAVEAQIAARPK